MKQRIVNRITSSSLITIDLEDYYPEGKRVVLDIKDWLYEGIILKEKDFRAFVADHAWEQYRDVYVAMHCSTDAIVPGWAFMLITTRLQPYAKQIVLGDLELLETVLFKSVLEKLDVSSFKDKPLIVKDVTINRFPKTLIYGQPKNFKGSPKSIMYGEAYLPLFKK